MITFLCGKMNRWPKLIYHMERVLLVRENTFLRASGRSVPRSFVPRSFVPRFESVRTQVWVSSYLSLSQFVPKVESVSTQVWVSSYPSLSQFVPKFESVRTQAWVSSYPTQWSILTWLLPFPIIRNTSRASAWIGVNRCVRQGSIVKRVSVADPSHHLML